MSTEPKFTPGPWGLETVATCNGGGLCHLIGPFPSGPWKDGSNYACVYGDGLRIGIDENLPRAKELLANARLIAAAPDMYAALSEVEAASKRTNCPDEFALLMIPVMGRIFEILRRARGEV